MKESFKKAWLKIKETRDSKFNIIYFFLLPTLWYIYSANIDKNIMVGVIALVITILIFALSFYFTLLDIKEFNYRNKIEKWIKIFYLVILLVVITEFLYILYSETLGTETLGRNTGDGAFCFVNWINIFCMARYYN